MCRPFRKPSNAAHDLQTYRLFRAWGDFAIAGRIHSYPVRIIPCPGTGNRYHSAVTGGKVNAQGYLLATSEQPEQAGHKHRNGDRIHLPESQQGVPSPTPCPSRTCATYSSAIQTRPVIIIRMIDAMVVVNQGGERFVNA
jgi:hypothetical protein